MNKYTDNALREIEGENKEIFKNKLRKRSRFEKQYNYSININKEDPAYGEQKFLKKKSKRIEQILNIIQEKFFWNKINSKVHIKRAHYTYENIELNDQYQEKF